MSSESLRESLSALMDNEADELEVRRVLKASAEDESLRSDWSRYQTARALMHKEPWQNSIDLSAGIAAAIADDPVPAPAATPVSKKVSRVWQGVGRLAVAASVTVAVLVGVNMFQQDGPAGDGAMVAEQAPAVSLPGAPATQPGAVLAGYSQPATAGEESKQPVSEWQEQRIGTYLRQHAAQGDGQLTPEILPSARAASLEAR